MKALAIWIGNALFWAIVGGASAYGSDHQLPAAIAAGIAAAASHLLHPPQTRT